MCVSDVPCHSVSDSSPHNAATLLLSPSSFSMDDKDGKTCYLLECSVDMWATVGPSQRLLCLPLCHSLETRTESQSQHSMSLSSPPACIQA